MSCETDLFCAIPFLGKTYNSKYEVEEDLRVAHRGIKRQEATLRDLAMMTDPEKYYNRDEYESSYDWVGATISDALEQLDEFHEDAFRLQLLLDNWDLCHDKDGLAVAPPWGMEFRAYLDGDFVKTKEETFMNGRKEAVDVQA